MLLLQFPMFHIGIHTKTEKRCHLKLDSILDLEEKEGKQEQLFSMYGYKN